MANSQTPNFTLSGVGRYVETNHAILNAPNALVNTNCANNPTPIAMAPLARLRGFNSSTRPPYSPILLGVNIAQVRPQKTDLMATHQLIFSIRSLRYFHLTTSKAQFMNIITTTIMRVIRTDQGSILCSREV